jgi:hypothetical protein
LEGHLKTIYRQVFFNNEAYFSSNVHLHGKKAGLPYLEGEESAMITHLEGEEE